MYLNQFIEYHRTRADPYNLGNRFTQADPYSKEGPDFWVPDPVDTYALNWDPDAWLRMKQKDGFLPDEIAKLQAMYDDYWTKTRRRRRPVRP